MRPIPILATLALMAALTAAANAAEPDLTGQDRPAPAVDPALPHYIPAPPMTGDLHIVGGGGVPGSYCESLVQLWVGIFQRAHPLVKVHTAIYATGSTPPDLAEEYAQIGFMTREILPFEEALFRHKKWKPLGIPIAGATYDSIGLVTTQLLLVNKENPITRLTMAQVDAIFSKTRNRAYKEEITTWGQLGLTGDWADKPVDALGSTEMPNGSTVYFLIQALKRGQFKDSVRYVNSADTPAAVAADKYAIGFAYLQRGQSWPNTKAPALSESDSGPFVALSYEAVLNRTWPLCRQIYVYVNTYSNKPIDPLAKEFMRVALSREGQEAAARTPFMPLTAEAVQRSLELIR